MRDLVEDFLLAELVEEPLASPVLVAIEDEDEDFDPDLLPPSFLTKVEAFKAVGLLSEEDAAAWLERFARASEEQAPHDVPLETRTRAIAFLDDLAKKADEDALWDAFCILEDAGVLSAEDHERWEIEDGDDDPCPEPSMHELRRVFLGPVEQIDGCCVVCVEIYEECALVRWTARMEAKDGRTTAPSTARASMLAMENMFETEVALRDDLGTSYEASFGGGGGSWGKAMEMSASTLVTPAAPDAATQLTVNIGGRKFPMRPAS